MILYLVLILNISYLIGYNKEEIDMIFGKVRRNFKTNSQSNTIFIWYYFLNVEEYLIIIYFMIMNIARVLYNSAAYTFL